MAVQPVVQAAGQQTVVVVQQAGDASVDASADSCSVIMFVLGIFFPLLCLINGCMHACHKSKKAACFGKVSLILGLIELIGVVVVIVVVITSVGVAVSSFSAASLSAAGSCAMKYSQSICKGASNCRWDSMSADGSVGMCKTK